MELPSWLYSQRPGGTGEALLYRPARLDLQFVAEVPAIGWPLEASRRDEDVILADLPFMRAVHSLLSTSRRRAHFQL
jgi:hypothetical protein